MKSKTDRLFKQLQRQLRAKAQSQLAHAEATEPIDMSVDSLMYELQVHQIELEMQNDELQRTLEELHAAKNRYAELYDFAPVGYLTVNAVGVIDECNLTFAGMLGIDRKKIIKRRFAQLIADEDKDNWYRFFLQIKKRREKQRCELTLVRDDGSHFFAGLVCLCLDVDSISSPLLNISVNDITTRKEAEQALRIAAEAFDAQEAILVTDTDKTILRANNAFYRITGYSHDEIIGLTPSFLQSGMHDKEFYENLWATITREGYWEGEIWDKKKNGDIFPILLNIARIDGDNGRSSHYVGCFTDITLQKEAERILKNHHGRLQDEMRIMLSELEKTREEISEANTAVGFLLKQQNLNLVEARSALSREAERTVMPFLNMLKKTTGNKAESRLIGLLQDNLQHLLESYGKSPELAGAYQKLTPVEIQVASMVRQGWPTKRIAATLSLSTGTVSIHRKHIRKKLGLDSKAINLSSYLMSLNDDGN